MNGNWVNNLKGSPKQVAWAASIVRKSYDTCHMAMLELGDYNGFMESTLDEWADHVTQEFPNASDWINKRIMYAR